MKEEYRKHLQTLGATGAGLAPEDVTDGSEMANLVGTCFFFLMLYKVLVAKVFVICRVDYLAVAMVEGISFILEGITKL